MLDSSDQSSLPLRRGQMHRVVCLSETYVFDMENFDSVDKTVKTLSMAPCFQTRWGKGGGVKISIKIRVGNKLFKGSANRADRL